MWIWKPPTWGCLLREHGAAISVGVDFCGATRKSQQWDTDLQDEWLVLLWTVTSLKQNVFLIEADASHVSGVGNASAKQELWEGTEYQTRCATEQKLAVQYCSKSAADTHWPTKQILKMLHMGLVWLVLERY